METPSDERVLVLMPTARDGERTVRALAEAGLLGVACADIVHVCREIGRGAGAALIAEEALSADRQGCLVRTLNDQPPWSDFPLVVLAREGATDAPIREVMNATLIDRPLKIRSMLSVVRAALRSRRRQYEVRGHLAERRRAEEAQGYLVKLADTLRPLSVPDDVQAAASRALGEHLGANRVAYFEIAGPDFVVERDYADGVESLAGRYRVTSFGSSLPEAFLAGRTVVEDDATTFPGRSPEERAAFEAIRVRGHVDVPLVKEGAFVAGMTVHFCNAHEWTVEEVSLIEQTAERTWAAVERARSERALRASEERFRRAMGIGTVGVLFFGLDGRVTDANAAFERLSGYTRDELLCHLHQEALTRPEFLGVTARAAAELAERGVTAPYEKEMIRKDGSRWWGLCAPTRLSGHGRDSECVEFVVDITHAKRAEEAARERDERLQLLLGHATDYAVIISDPEDRVLEWLGGAEEITGWRADEVMGKPLHILFTPEDRAAGAPEWETTRAAETGRAENVRWHLRKDGSRFFGEGVTVAVRGTNGELRGFGKVFRDATARKLAEERLIRDAMLLANVHDAVVMTDLGGVVTYWNEGAARLFGWTAAEMVGRRYADRFAEPLRSWVDAEIRKRVTGSEWSGEYEDYRKDGSRVWIDSRVTSIRDAAGTVVGVLGVSHDISERKRAEESLRAGEERFRTLFESMDEGYCVVEPLLDDAGRPVDYRYLLANPALEHHTGLRDVVGKTAREVMPGHESHWIEAYAGVAATGEPIRRTGRAEDLGRWYEVAAFPVGNGQVGVLFADVTARHLAEEELRASEARLAEIFRHAPSFMGVLSGPGHVFERVNDRYLELIGGRDVVGLPVREALPEVEGQGFFEMLDQVYLTGEPYTGTGRRVTLSRGGRLEERVLDFVYQPIRGATGVITGVLVQGIDTTERKRAEAALRERDERLQLAVAIARMGTFVIDLTTDTATVNETGRDIYGWVNTRTTFAQVQTHFHPDDKEDVMRQVGTALAPAGPGMFEVEQRIIRTDGAVRWLRVRGQAIFEGEGATRRAVLLIGAYLDVTEQKEAEESLRDADRKKDDFIALLAHELRNPLAPIRNGLGVLRLVGADEAAAAETREIMERQIAHMVRLIDDLLDVSRINRNKMELRLSTVTLAEAVKSALETVRPMIDAGGHALTVSIPDGPIYIEADLTRLAQVFGNLLSNSAKYTRHGGKIWLTAERRGGEVAVSVRDNGIGIPAESLANIFDMFSQVDRSVERATGGLGIGLALVKGLVEMHGGTVAAESLGEGQGSTFTVALPVAATPALPSAAPKGDGQNGFRRKILIVDDSHDGANTLARMLRLMGNDVRIANDGLEGVEAAGEFLPEVVLMDVGMPVLNGLDATRRIREQEWGRDMTIIALTGWGQEGDKERSREAGCDGHLVKPVDFDDLEGLLGTRPA